jgi:prepilin-type processing-associated H-X9-DG protein
MDRESGSFRFSGNGIAGINQAFSIDEFDNGQATLVALEEIRAGIHAVDPRGAWALGQIAASITWAHGVNGDDYGPNNLFKNSDDILGCPRLHELLGKEMLAQEGMPCVSYLDFNQNATARSRHPGGVNVLFLDGRVRFVSDRVDRGLWHVMHSRETPRDVLPDGFDRNLARIGDVAEAPADARLGAPDGEPLSTRENSLGMQFVLIPAGEFTMGVPDAGNTHNLPDECPPHKVRLTRPYYLGSHEVTQQQFAQVMGRNPSFHQPDAADEETSDQFPVEQVTWNEARDFCRQLAELSAERTEGRRYRLPTEAEWEYASRAGSTAPYNWHLMRPAQDDSGDAAGIQPALPVKPVGTYPPNALGLYDMRGNVWEWTADWFDREYYRRSPVEDPRGPERGFIKVVRGSDWTFVGEGCKINYPMLAPWKSSRTIGFRVVCELVPRDRR